MVFKKKAAILIDGGCLRVAAHRNNIPYNNDFIESFAHGCVDETEDLLKILYYDCAPYKGTIKLPISKMEKEFLGGDEPLHELARRNLFAVRRGKLKFRGWQLKKHDVPPGELTDKHFKPGFVQKGVDMRIGLEISLLAENRSVDRVILVTEDTDFIPAMKHGRRGGLQVVTTLLPGSSLSSDFLAHVDILRKVSWPESQS